MENLLEKLNNKEKIIPILENEESVNEEDFMYIKDEIVQEKDKLIGKNVKIETTFGGCDTRDITLKGTIVDITKNHIILDNLLINGKEMPRDDKYLWHDGKVKAIDIYYMSIIDSLIEDKEYTIGLSHKDIKDNNLLNKTIDLGETIEFILHDDSKFTAPIVKSEFNLDRGIVNVTCIIPEYIYEDFMCGLQQYSYKDIKLKNFLIGDTNCFNN